jgi:hypothetical protein
MSDFRYLDEDDNVRLTWPLKNGAPAHVLTREERSRGGLARALRASERRLSREGRGSERLEQAAKRLGELLRSDDIDEAMWADDVLRRHIGEPPK